MTNNTYQIYDGQNRVSCDKRDTAVNIAKFLSQQTDLPVMVIDQAGRPIVTFIEGREE